VFAFITALRPHQWVKNILVFVPALAAHQFTLGTVGKSLIAFLSFSLVASSVYVLNDLLDLNADRAHPRKRHRPFASGIIPVSQGRFLTIILLMVGLVVAAFLGTAFGLIVLVYYFVTAAYSLFLKRLLIVDICTLAGLYTMRIFAGGVAAQIYLSVWLLAFSIFFFFSLAAVKRQGELVDGLASGEVTAHGRGYEVNDLALVTNMALSSGYVSVLVMALYVSSPSVRELYHQPYALWGICLVLLYWISRIVMVTHRGGMHDDPIVFAIKDQVSWGCVVLAVLFAFGGVML
jgi:4-hydroxybenzoate polyprenyltransferase